MDFDTLKEILASLDKDMDFSKALILIKQGKKVRRPAWNQGSYLDLKQLEEFVEEHIIYDDLMATDWEITK
jgi:hypothetical protein